MDERDATSQSASPGTPKEEGPTKSRLEADVRYHEHHERKATEELDRAGIEKIDDEDRMDSTDDSAGQPWSIYMRIRFLRRERDKLKHELAATQHKGVSEDQRIYDELQADFPDQVLGEHQDKEDYSPAYQDEYQRLWHREAARAKAFEAALRTVDFHIGRGEPANGTESEIRETVRTALADALPEESER